MTKTTGKLDTMIMLAKLALIWFRKIIHESREPGVSSPAAARSRPRWGRAAKIKAAPAARAARVRETPHFRAQRAETQPMRKGEGTAPTRWMTTILRATAWARRQGPATLTITAVRTPGFRNSRKTAAPRAGT